MVSGSDGSNEASPAPSARFGMRHSALFFVPALLLYFAMSGRAGRLELGAICVQTTSPTSVALGTSAAVGGLGLIWVARRSFRWWVTGLVWALAVLLIPVAGAIGGLHLLFSRNVVSQCPPTGSPEFSLLYAGLGQGAEVELARVLADNPLFRAYRILAIHRDPPTPAAYLVLPEGTDSTEAWQIHEAPDGFVAGFLGRRNCVVAFDPSNGRSWGVEGVYDSEDCVLALSPFRLIGPTGTPSPADVDLLVGFATMERGTPAAERRLPSCVEEEVLLDALDHPNPAVRDAARRVFEAGGPELYPRGSKAIR